MKEDPREMRIVAWEETVPLYPVRVEGLGKGEIIAGTNYPREGGASYVVHAFLEQPLEDARQVRLLMRKLHRALLAQVEENRAYDAGTRFGAEDQASSLPFSRPGLKRADVFWMRLLEVPRPVMAVRCNFHDKELLKDIFSQTWRDAKGSPVTVRSGWNKEAKLWWVWAEHAFPAILGGMRKAGFRLRWVQRRGFPPAPPIDEG